jgi:hypothetical protein
MTVQRQAWLLGPDTAGWTTGLARRLEERGLHVEILGADQVEAWRKAGQLPTVRSLPHVVFIDGTLAAERDAELLAMFDRPGPWRGPPRIVVVDVEDRAFVDRCYAFGVANVVRIFEPASLSGQAAIETTARYWAQTSLLPNADYFVAEPPV